MRNIELVQDYRMQNGPYQYPIRDINSMLQSVIEPPIGISNKCIIDITVDNAIAIADIINCVV